jgi:hypothetical protein
MTFAAPLFLLAAMAAAIPVVLHMINRQKAKDMPFPTLRFLKLSVQKTRRRKRVHDALLMAIRAAVLLLIAAGLARPTMTSLSALWGGAHCAAAIVLDNSASMGMIDQDRVRFDTATAAAGQILDQLGDADQAALLLTGGPTFAELGKLDRTQDSVRQILGQCRVSYQRADLAMKIQQARKLLAKSEAPNKQIYVITDMQKISWENLKLEIRNPKSEIPSPGSPHPNPLPKGEGTDIPIIVIDCNRTPKPNVAVQGVEIEAAVPVAGLPVKATVTLLNTSTVAQQRLVELTLDGAKQSSSPQLSIPPEGRVKHTFAFTFQRGGLHRGEVHLIGEDGSKYDDRRYFTLEVDQGIPVAVVKPQRHEIPYLDDGYYLERALSPGRSGGGAIRTTTLVAGDLMSEPLEKYKVVFCVNLSALGADAAERLRSYVAGGGNVMWICGDNVNPEAYNLMNEEARGGLLPAPLADARVPGPQDNRDSWHISFLDRKHPALSHLVEPASLYESVLIYRHVRMAAGQGGTWVLARLDDGEPLLVQRKVERGRALMLGTSAHVNWSNLPLRPIFLPLVARLTFDLAEAEQTRHNVVAGQPLVLQFAEETRPVGVEVVPPSGETLRLKTEGQQGKPGQTFRYADTYAIGVYLLRLLDAVRPTQIAYSVNFDPDEPDLATMDRKELEERLGATPLAFAENPDDLSSTFAWLREGKSLWRLFLTAVLIALVFETFISNRLR